MTTVTGLRRLAASAVTLILLVVALTACSDDSGSGSDSQGAGPVMVTITQKDGTITPSSDLVQADVGQKIMFMVTTDEADEIHVHSEPEHEFEIKPGPEQTFTFTVGTPGTIEVESHGLDTEILKLEIS
jgi:plastocyanin